MFPPARAGCGGIAECLAMKVVVESEALLHKVRSTINPEDEVIPERSGGMAESGLRRSIRNRV